MVHLPDVAIGTIVASLIAGIVALLGLIISKEQKTSEFRQAWIDALRSDFSAYLTQINAIHDTSQVMFKDQAEKVSKLSPLYLVLNGSSFNIMLRVNPDEKKSKRLLRAMECFNRLTASKEELTTANIRVIETEFILAAQVLLKYEWRRVKYGERTFKIAKILALCIILTCIIFGCLALYEQWKTHTNTPAASSLNTTLDVPDSALKQSGVKR
jgi:hypothetical protein